MRVKVLLITAAMMMATGCSESTEPEGELVLTMQNLAGIYYGVTFTTEEDGVVTNQLRQGASIELILYAQGTTDGRLFIPADTAGGGSDLDVGLDGTWQLDDNIVTLSHSSDTFLEQMDLAFEETYLTGEADIGGITYSVVLAW